jgi:hypothetical protein
LDGDRRVASDLDLAYLDLSGFSPLNVHADLVVEG